MSSPSMIMIQQYLQQALLAVRAGHDPNATIPELIKAHSTQSARLCHEIHSLQNSPDGFGECIGKDMLHRSALSMAILTHQTAIREELIRHGATFEIRSNQPTNLICVALAGYHVLLRDLATQYPDLSDRRKHIKNVILTTINDLAAHGVRCDPETLSQHNKHRSLSTRSSVEKDDPFLALTELKWLSLDDHQDIIMALLHCQASPQHAMETILDDIAELPALVQTIFGRDLQLLQQCQALADAITERHLLQTAVETTPLTQAAAKKCSDPRELTILLPVNR